MDATQSSSPRRSTASTKIKPLRPRKQKDQTHPAQQSQNTSTDHAEPPYPLRTSSLRSRVSANSESHSSRDTRSTTISVQSSTRTRDNHSPNQSFAQPKPVRTARRTDSHSRSGTKTSGLMGDFVLLDSGADMTHISERVLESAPSRKVSVETSQVRQRTQAIQNPYEFEPSTPYDVHNRQNHFGDPIDKQPSVDRPNQRHLHTKNSRSEDNSGYTPRVTERDTFPSPIRPIGRAIHRSESSPSLQSHPVLQPLTYLPRPEKAPSARSNTQYAEYHETKFPSPPDQHHFAGVTSNLHNVDAERSYPPIHQPSRDYASTTASHSSRSSRHDSSTSSYAPHRSLTGSPTKTLYDVSEIDELDMAIHGYPLSTPKKRSRSPMKKMFGEHGWLGNSPDDKPDKPARNNKSSTFNVEDTSHRHQKKTSIMGKLKNKFEEFAEKAELTPPRSSRSERERHPKLSMLSVSLGPPEQARIFMELELMLVHTANCFLMTQFSQGRIAVDSIKKTVDVWKNKGRPIVIEFMYDQATQRELVAANQHNFRFHGARAGDDIRINSMLYNWKQVANLMSIRTFCTADTVLLKLLFDIEQILELLGAGEPMLLRLQQIRTSANEMMRVARHNKEVESAAQSVPRGRQMAWNAHTSSGSGSLNGSVDEYGGLKLVPETYKD